MPGSRPRPAGAFHAQPSRNCQTSANHRFLRPRDERQRELPLESPHHPCHVEIPVVDCERSRDWIGPCSECPELVLQGETAAPGGRVAREASNSTLSRNCCNRNGKLLMKPEPLAALAGLALETKHKTAPDPVTQMLVSSTWVLALLCKGYSVGTPYKVHFRGSTIYTVTAPLHRPTHEIADLRLAPSREV